MELSTTGPTSGREPGENCDPIRGLRDAAYKVYKKAYYGGALRALREARENTRRALSAKIKLIASENSNTVALSARIEELDKQIDVLKDKQREPRPAALKQEVLPGAKPPVGRMACVTSGRPSSAAATRGRFRPGRGRWGSGRR